jgi:hypothetical protein
MAKHHVFRTGTGRLFLGKKVTETANLSPIAKALYTLPVKLSDFIV